MNGKSHMCFGFGAFLGVCAADMAINGKCTMSYPELAVGLGSCIIGSLAPDIDHPQSKISNADIGLGLLSRGVCTVTSHRRHTHTLVFCVLGGVAAYLLALLTIRHANSSVAFLAALSVFILLHLDETSGAKRYASIIAVCVYFGLPIALGLIPVDIPTVTIPASFAKYVGIFFAAGWFSHLFADALCIQGVPMAWPIVPMNKHLRLAPIETGGILETIVTTAVSVLFVGCAYLLYRAGYFMLPF